MNRTWVVLAAVGLLLPGLFLPQASAEPTAPRPKVTSYKLQVDVAGYVEVTSAVDTTGPCVTGRRYVQSNEFDFDSGNWARLTLTQIRLPGQGSTLTSSFTSKGGSARMNNGYTNWGVTRDCPPTGPEPVPPTCISSSGKIRVSLQQGSTTEEQEEEEGLTGLLGTTLLLAISRVGGSSNDGTCMRGGAENIIGGGGVPQVDASKSVLTPSPTAGPPSVIVPVSLGDVSFARMGRKTLKRTIVASGVCDRVTVDVFNGNSTASPPQGTVYQDGDCFVRAKVVLKVRAAR
jgi:hypothetical protein